MHKLHQMCPLVDSHTFNQLKFEMSVGLNSRLLTAPLEIRSLGVFTADLPLGGAVFIHVCFAQGARKPS